AIIGSDTALRVLETYAIDSRSAVVKELINAWNYFDRDIYAKMIISKTFKGENIRFFNLPSLSGFQYITNSKNLDLHNFEHVSDLSPLANLTQLTSLSLHNFGPVNDLSPLTNLTRLTFLSIGYFKQVSDLSPLANL